MSKRNHRLIFALAVAVAAAVYVHFDLSHRLTLDGLKQSRGTLLQFYESHPAGTITAFFVAYVFATALSLPGAAVLTLAGGALFGVVVGTLVVSFASSVGATLAFLTSRYLLRDAIQARFGDRLSQINEGMRRDGISYLLTLRLVPLFPFFLVNLLVGLTTIPAASFYWVSQLGMLAGTVVYVNAGTQLARIQKLSDILSPALLISFLLLGFFPLLAGKGVKILRRRKVYANWMKPVRFDRNLVVIGAGAAGLVAAYIGAAVKAKVTLVEAHKMGGDCLNFGCVPSKTLIRTAKFLKQVKTAQSLGIREVNAKFDFADVMARVQRVIKTIAPHDSIERYTKLGVDVVQGHARIISPWSVAITTPNGTRVLTTRSIVIATGARPFVPRIPGIDSIGYYTSDTIWTLTELPKRLVVLGGGPIGCELAQCFARLGADVTLVEMEPRLMMREDPEVSALVTAALIADGIKVLTSHQATRCERDGGSKRLFVRREASESIIEFGILLCAVGRAPRTEGIGLEQLGIPLTPRNTIETDAYLQTRYPNILACGDVAGPYQFTHTAAHQAWYVTVNALFGSLKRFKVDYSVIPWATFTDPEVARVGLSETEAKEKGIPYEVTRYGLDDLDRAIADESAQGFIKVLTVPGKDRILGVTLVGEHAGDLLAEYVLAMKQGLGLNKILGTIHTYPTLAEANKYVAGEWKRAHVSQRLLAWVERFHTWQRA